MNLLSLTFRAGGGQRYDIHSNPSSSPIHGLTLCQTKRRPNFVSDRNTVSERYTKFSDEMQLKLNKKGKFGPG